MLEVDLVDNVATSLGKDNEFYKLLENKISGLKKSFRNLIPKTRVKRSWEGLGSAIKWIAGNADADDLRYINDKFNNIQKSQNSLIEGNNEQVQINNLFEDRINEISKSLTSISLKIFLKKKSWK